MTKLQRSTRQPIAIMALTSATIAIGGCGTSEADSSATIGNDAVSYVEYVDPVVPPEEFAAIGSEVLVATVIGLRQVALEEDPVSVDGVVAPQPVAGHYVADLQVDEVFRGSAEAGDTISLMYEDVLADEFRRADETQLITLAVADKIVFAADWSVDGAGNAVLVPFSSSTLAKVSRGTALTKDGAAATLDQIRRQALAPSGG